MSTRSSALCIVCPTSPNSATGQWAWMKRASEVPPVVLSSGVRPVTAPIAAARQSLTGPGGTRNDSPLTSQESRYLPPTAASRRSTQSCRLALDHLSLKRMLNVARATPGAMLVAGLPMSIVVTCRLDGWKCSVPSSSGVVVKACSIATSRCAALSTRCGYATWPCTPSTTSAAGHAAATADLDHVAERRGRGRLADDAGVEHLAALAQPIEHLPGAVDRRGLLVAGDQQADRAGELVAARRQKPLGGGDKGGDRPLHVDRAAAAQLAVAQHWRRTARTTSPRPDRSAPRRYGRRSTDSGGRCPGGRIG